MLAPGITGEEASSLGLCCRQEPGLEAARCSRPAQLQAEPAATQPSSPAPNLSVSTGLPVTAQGAAWGALISNAAIKKNLRASYLHFLHSDALQACQAPARSGDQGDLPHLVSRFCGFSSTAAAPGSSSTEPPEAAAQPGPLKHIPVARADAANQLQLCHANPNRGDTHPRAEERSPSAWPWSSFSLHLKRVASADPRLRRAQRRVPAARERTNTYSRAAALEGRDLPSPQHGVCSGYGQREPTEQGAGKESERSIGQEPWESRAEKDTVFPSQRRSL